MSNVFLTVVLVTNATVPLSCRDGLLAVRDLKTFFFVLREVCEVGSERTVETINRSTFISSPSRRFVEAQSTSTGQSSLPGSLVISESW